MIQVPFRRKITNRMQRIVVTCKHDPTRILEMQFRCTLWNSVNQSVNSSIAPRPFYLLRNSSSISWKGRNPSFHGDSRIKTAWSSLLPLTVGATCGTTGKWDRGNLYVRIPCFTCLRVININHNAEESEITINLLHSVVGYYDVKYRMTHGGLYLSLVSRISLSYLNYQRRHGKFYKPILFIPFNFCLNCIVRVSNVISFDSTGIIKRRIYYVALCMFDVCTMTFSPRFENYNCYHSSSNIRSIFYYITIIILWFLLIYCTINKLTDII